MKKYILILVSIFLMQFIISCSSNESVEIVEENEVDTSTPVETFDVSYGDSPRHIFDLYLPANRTSSSKTVILIHGGGWNSGDKSSMDPIKNLVKLEFPNLAIANMNYRLADKDVKPLPDQTDDISLLVDFLKKNKKTLSISEDIGIIGISAGAHLGLLWSYNFDTDSQVDMVCSIVGPTNFTDPAYLNNTNGDIQELINQLGVDTSSSFLEKASPFHQVNASAPPTILFYGGQDPLVPISQGIDLRDRLIELGVTHQFTLYENEGHGWIGPALLDTWNKLADFMETHL